MEKIFLSILTKDLGPGHPRGEGDRDVEVPLNMTETFVWALLHSILICRSLRHHIPFFNDILHRMPLTLVLR